MSTKWKQHLLLEADDEVTGTPFHQGTYNGQVYYLKHLLKRFVDKDVQEMQRMIASPSDGGLSPSTKGPHMAGSTRKRKAGSGSNGSAGAASQVDHLCFSAIHDKLQLGVLLE